MDNSKQATLELGTKPVGSLLMQYALPAIAAMTAASLYNMTDSIFIGQGCGPSADWLSHSPCRISVQHLELE